MERVEDRLALGLEQPVAPALAGVDPVEGDRYGRMALTEAGLAARDRFVIDRVRAAGIPLVLLLSGGYATTPFRTAELHAVAFRVAVELYEGRAGVAHRASA